MHIRHRLTALLSGLGALLILNGCATTPAAGPTLVTGTATYRERIALPPQAEFEASVEDVSRVGAPSVRVGEIRMPLAGVPVRFSIPVEASRLTRDGRYSLRARITLGDRLLYTSDTVYPVLGSSGLTHADILLRPVPAQPVADAPLENTYWKLVSLGNETVTVADARREPHLILQARERRVAGSGGCNRFTGGYTLDGQALSFSRVAGTLMACVQGGEYEAAFLKTLSATTRWRVDAGQLELIDAQGAVLARFVAVHLR
ncbi:META domain-containing protein [Uliginosibacterium sp. H1]|uniref:META domain-containing protein n=1 Tax=Uliginosibacterium sp. H1 TaxID=3114757 RepID=UPI002E1731EC|nr:META domain-containing protein [Uliginosibacterium sp. H1]